MSKKTIFMIMENSETNKPNRRLDIKRSNKHVALQNSSILTRRKI